MINWLTSLSSRTLFIIILAIGVVLHLLHYPFAMGPGHFTLIDEVDAYRWSWNLLYYSHAHFGTYLPGPWQNILGFLLLKGFSGSAHGLYSFWLLFGILQMPLTYWFVRQVANRQVALLAMLFAAVLPYALRLSGNFWNPNFILPLLTLSLGFYFKLIQHHKSWASGPFFFFFSLLPFFHMIPLLLVPALALGLFYFRVRLNFVSLAFGIFASLFFWLPFVYLDWMNDFYILKGNAQFGTATSEFSGDTFKIFYHPITTLTSDISRFLGHDFRSTRFYMNRYYGGVPIGILFSIPSILLALTIWFIYFKNTFDFKTSEFNKKLNLFVFFIFTSSAVLFVIKLKPHQDRYVILWWPLMMWVAGQSTYYLLLWFKKHPKTWIKTAGFSFLLLTLLQTIYSTATLSIHERLSGTGHSVRLTHSLITLEVIESALKSKLNLGTQKGPKQVPTLFEAQKKDHSLFHLKGEFYPQPVTRLPIFINTRDIEQKIEPWREERLLIELGIFWEYNGYLARVTDPKETKHQLLISPPSLSLRNLAEGWEKIGELPGIELWYKLLP